MSRTRSDFRFADAPGALPGLGHTLRVWRTPLSFLSSLPSQGDLVRVRLGRLPVYVVCHPELADQVLRDSHTYPKGGPGYAQIRTLLGDGIVTCPNAKHKRTRRILQPPFQRTRVADYIPTMVETADAVTGAWRSGVPRDVMREMTAVAAMIGVRTMFAAEITEHHRDETHACIEEIIGGIHHEVLTSALGVRWLFPHRTRRFHRALTSFEQIIDEVIFAYRRSGGEHADILSMLMAARDDVGEPMSDREVRDNVINMFTAATAAGRASAMVWALHLLDRHPDIARRVQHEIDSVLGGDPPDDAALRRLELTRHVVLETLRLYPHGWLVFRTVATPVELAGQILPSGTSLLVSPYQLHRQPRLFPDPERFDPDRWATEAPGLREAYIPFGNGSRKCLGEAFALTEIVVVLARVLQSWTLHEQAASSRPLVPRVNALLQAPPLVMTPQLRGSRS
ncbi:cytochrome P450 [Streptomyces sp. NBC_00878]|uniref:cytochrome P450 n=1 Tax=Streptomyces sp. NBC_00878 TaxID=2975854 RepID=UPI0022596BB9|nr:cytochrome P450 [Streptomyces sp. NBC_00878]MCX4907478.1 cytochrome P450 [Streptomyces sp. NBC_00878]